MTTTDPLAVLNPSVIGQAEKTHTAFLHRLLGDTGIDEPQWVSLQITQAAGPIARPELTAAIAAKAKYPPAGIAAALDGLSAAGLVTTDGDRMRITDDGTELVARLRRRTAELVGPAYAAVPEQDRVVAARVLTQITAALSAQLAS